MMKARNRGRASMKTKCDWMKKFGVLEVFDGERLLSARGRKIEE